MTPRIKVCRWSSRIAVGAFVRRPFGSLVALAIVAAVAMAGCSSQAGSPSAPASGAPVAAAADAAAVEQDYVHVVQAVQPSVVQITTDQGLGSGIVYDGQGNIVTNGIALVGAAVPGTRELTRAFHWGQSACP